MIPFQHELPNKPMNLRITPLLLLIFALAKLSDLFLYLNLAEIKNKPQNASKGETILR